MVESQLEGDKAVDIYHNCVKNTKGLMSNSFNFMSSPSFKVLFIYLIKPNLKFSSLHVVDGRINIPSNMCKSKMTNDHNP